MVVFLDRIYGINRIFKPNSEVLTTEDRHRVRDILQDTYRMTGRVIMP
jgi:hypothetical protein